MSTDYFPPIQRAIQNLSPNTLDARRALYDKARAALLKQLKGADPALTESQITKERLLLEDAIRRIETDMLRPETATRVLGTPRTAPATPQVRPPEPARPAMAEAMAPAGLSSPYDDEDDDDYDGVEEDDDDLYDDEPPPQSRFGRRADARRPLAPQRNGRSGKGLRYALIGLGILVLLGGGAAAMLLLPKFVSQEGALKPVAEAPTPAESSPAPSSGKLTDRLGGEPAPPPTASANREPTGASTEPRQAEPVDTARSEPTPEVTAPAPLPTEQRQAALPESAPMATEPPGPPPEPTASASPTAPPAAAVSPAPAPTPTPAEPTPSTATAALPASPPAAQPLAPAPRAGTTVAQTAVLFEEQPDSPQRGQAFQGTVTWRSESVSGGANAPLETAVKGEIEIPERKIRANVTIRKNGDPALPATHTLEIQFIVPNDFPNGGIANVPGVLMKQGAQQRGQPLQGLSVKVTNGFFLVGLSDSPTDPGRNEELLKGREWIDIPILYDNGRRAILTLEKGVPGGQVFEDAFAAWGTSSAQQ